MVFAFESIILLSQISAAPASGLNSGWVNRAWQLEDGLPDSVVSGISQTADGYLWVGTLGGLARFDGIKFKNISLKLESQTVQSMFIDRHDRLWLAMDRGPVLCLAEGTYREFTVADGLRNAPLRHLAEDGEGGLWIASLSAQVSRIKDGRVTSFGQESGVPGRGAASVASDQKGQLWLCKAGDLALFQEGRFQKKFETMDNGALIASARSGGIWVYANSQLYRCGVAEGLEKRASLPLGPRVTPTVMLEDRAGAVWLGTIADGLFYCNDANCDHVPTSHPEITSLAQDREIKPAAAQSAGVAGLRLRLALRINQFNLRGHKQLSLGRYRQRPARPPHRQQVGLFISVQRLGGCARNLYHRRLPGCRLDRHFWCGAVLL